MRRILIANRGEIAVRIARACRDTGRTSIAVYADQDADAEFVRLADEAYALDGTRPADTYLDVAKLIDVARRAGADGVHPGYGFLSENAAFAQAVLDAGLIWIGPPPAVIAALGDKVEARRIAEAAGAPLVSGSPGPIASAAEAVAFAREHGLPIAIKAAHGGGGRGMRVARTLDEVGAQFDAAVSEATAAFGRGECFIERFVDRPRHVEVQVLADAHGTVVPLGTRDCSLQRRNQKLVEEAPAPFLTAEQERRLLDGARDICAAAGYVGAGTVEFLLGVDGTLSFLEVNTRLQVEHPVTEETTGLDLVAEQFRIAEGGRLDPRRPVARGHALEFRINAEDPARGFLPTPGLLSEFRAPAGPGVRVDAGVAAGQAVPGAFDSLTAKLVVWGADRAQALARARRALAEFEVSGVATVLPFHRAVVEHPDFAGDELRVHTRWIEEEFLPGRSEPLPDSPEPASLTRTWIEVDGRRVRLGVPGGFAGALGALGGSSAAPGADQAGADATANGAEEPGAVVAPLAGAVVRWLAADGDAVREGDPLVVLEAMKMESTVPAPAAGVVALRAEAGAFVAPGDVLAVIRG